MVRPIIARILRLENGQVNESHGFGAIKKGLLLKYPDYTQNPVSDCFYEKVIKVKADVAALLNLFSDVGSGRPMVAYGAVNGAPKGAFILTLESPISHFTIRARNEAKRSSVELRSVVEWFPL